MENNMQLQATIPQTTVPQTITTPDQERMAASLLAEVESELRRLEELRTAITKPQNEAIKAVNAQAKEVSAPLEDIKAKLQEVMGAYRLSPEVQDMIVKRKRMEKEHWRLQKEGTAEEIESVALAIQAVNELVPASVDAGEFDVRYRSGIEILSVDEAQLPERYWKRVVDEKAVKDDIELIGAVTGVEYRWVYKPSCYAKN
jgi:hypothetical protein